MSATMTPSPVAGATQGMASPPGAQHPGGAPSNPLAQQLQQSAGTIQKIIQVLRGSPAVDKTKLEQGAQMMRQGLMLIIESVKAASQGAPGAAPFPGASRSSRMNMSVNVERMADARWVNEVLNHENVRPWIAAGDTRIDVSSQIEDKRNVFLFGEHGGVGFLCVQDGIYEAHTSVLPSGRGRWTRAMTEACVRFMFTKTNAYEITTRIPSGHIGAKVAAEAQGMRFEFTQENGVFFRGKTVNCHIYSFRIQDWIPRAEGVVETGAWLHRRMEEEAVRLGIAVPTHEGDEIHNRYVGVAVEMMFGQQFLKAVSLYNRWVTLARHTRHGKLQHVSLVSVSPPVIQFDIGLMRFHEADIEVIRTC